MYTQINENIQVYTNFSLGSVEPLCFTWRNKDYNISKINFHYTSKKGATKKHHFSVCAESPDSYNITFDTERLTWVLEDICLTNQYF